MATQTVGRSSALAGTLGEVISEFFGTMVLILFGDGCVATFALFTNIGANNAPTPFANAWPVIIFGWGFAVMLGIYVAGAVSGAHINPAVTLALAARGKHPWNKVLPYWGGQVAGAFVAAAILYFVYQGALVHALSVNGLSISNIADSSKGYGWVFYTFPKAFVGTFGAFGDEFVGTALLVGLIFAITDARNQPIQGNLNPLISGGQSFAANNYYFWIPIVAPLLGGVAGAYIYDFTIHKVIEAKGLGPSGDTVTKGEAVLEPAVDTITEGRAVREPGRPAAE